MADFMTCVFFPLTSSVIAVLNTLETETSLISSFLLLTNDSVKHFSSAGR